MLLSQTQPLLGAASRSCGYTVFVFFVELFLFLVIKQFLPQCISVSSFSFSPSLQRWCRFLGSQDLGQLLILCVCVYVSVHVCALLRPSQRRHKIGSGRSQTKTADCLVSQSKHFVVVFFVLFLFPESFVCFLWRIQLGSGGASRVSTNRLILQ